MKAPNHLLRFIFLLGFLAPSAHAILDQDSDGMSDIWEVNYGFSTTNGTIAGQGPSQDPDGDGFSNLLESVAGTNPFSADPPFGSHHISYAPNLANPLSRDLQWQQIIGKQYQVWSSTDLTVGSWVPLSAAFIASSANPALFTTPPRSIAAPRNFQRVSVNDVDPDADGLSSSEENSLGTDSDSSDTDGDGSLDKDEVIQGSSPTNASDSGQPAYVPPPPGMLKLRLFASTFLGPTYPSTNFLSTYYLKIFKRDAANGAETLIHTLTYDGSLLFVTQNIEVPNDGSVYTVQAELPSIGTIFGQPYRDFKYSASVAPNPGSAPFTITNGFDTVTQQYGLSGPVLFQSNQYDIAFNRYRATISPSNIQEMSFSADPIISPSNYHQLVSDDQTTIYSAPQWANYTFSVFEPSAPINLLLGERNRSVAYTSGTKPQISAKFKFMTPALVPNGIRTYKVRATGSDGVNLPETALLSGTSADEYLLPSTTASAPFPANIAKFYPKNSLPNAFKLVWQYQALTNNGTTTTAGPWLNLNTTYHQVYLTKNQPTLPTADPGFLETFFYLACHNPSGQTNPDDIVRLIYDEFKDRQIQVVNKVTGQPSGAFLNYYGKIRRAEFQNRTGHLLTSGQAVCGGWADFLKDIFRVHGINSNSINLRVKQGVSASSGSASVVGLVGSTPKEFVLKPVSIPAGGESTAADELLPTFYFSGGSAIKIPAQGGLDKKREWAGHDIVRYISPTLGNIYFDPSYGTDQRTANNGNSAETDFSFRFAGFRGEFSIATLLSNRWWPVDSGNLDLDFSNIQP